MLPKFGTALVASLVAATQAGAAQGASPPQCAPGEQNAIDSIACGIEIQLAGLPSQTVVIAKMPVAGEGAGGPLKEPGALADRIATAIAARLGNGAHAVPGTRTLLAAHASTPDTIDFVVVDATLDAGKLEVNAEARSAAFGFWDRVRGTQPAPRRVASYYTRIDGALSSYLPVPTLVSTRIDKMPAPSPDIVGLACGDTDADASPELYVVGRHKIERGRIHGLFESLDAVSWTTLAPVAPSPLREPITTAEITPSGFLRVASTDRAEALTLAASLKPEQRFGGVFPVRYAGCLSRKGVALGSPAPCRSEDAPLMDVGSAPIDAIASGVSVTSAGKLRRVVAFRTPDGVATLKDDSKHVGSVPNVGAALAVADLDRDGVPEVVSSENTEAPASDAVVVRSFREDGSVIERLRVPVPEGVRAIATCPPDSFAMSPIVVATKTSLWVIR